MVEDLNPTQPSLGEITAGEITAVLAHRAVQTPEQTAYLFLKNGKIEESRLSYEQLDQKARAVAARIQATGAGGDPVLLIYPPGLDYIVAFLGVLHAGAVAVPVHPPHPVRPERTVPRLREIIKDAGPVLALTDQENQGRLSGMFRKDAPGMEFLTVDSATESPPSDWRKPAISPDSIAFLQYTSGATGAPKGVRVSHANLMANQAMIQAAFGSSEDSVICSWLPLYHDMGLIGGVLHPLYSGCLCVLMSPRAFWGNPLCWLQAISRYRATIAGGPDFAYELCVRRKDEEETGQLDLSSWEAAFNGSEPIRPETLERFSRAFSDCGFDKRAFFPCYGLAEATLMVSGGPKWRPPRIERLDPGRLARDHIQPAGADQEAIRLVSAGALVPGVRAAIVNPETRVICGENEVGEIWVTGENVARGYWGAPRRSRERFEARIRDTDPGPFLRTGDQGFLKDGELFVTGRIQDIIIMGGRSYYPQEIEKTAQQSHPRIRPGGVAAFEAELDGQHRLILVAEVERRRKGDRRGAREATAMEKDRRWQEGRRQYTELPEHILESAAPYDPETIIRAIRQSVSERHALPVHGILLIKTGDMPRTTSGKVQRHRCREAFLNNQLAVVGRGGLPLEGTEQEAVLDRECLLAVSPPEQQAILQNYFKEQLASLLETIPAGIDPDAPLTGLGLDSMMAVELQHRMETDLDLIWPMSCFLAGPSIRQLAKEGLERIQSLPRTASKPPADSPATFALSHNQRSRWSQYRLNPHGGADNRFFAARLGADTDFQALEKAFAVLTDRHPMLRTSYQETESGPVQTVHARMDPPLSRIQAADWRLERLQAQLEKDAHQPFDLENGPVFRLRLYQRDRHSVLLIAIHPIAGDSGSLIRLLDGLRRIYPLAKKGGDPAAALPPIQSRYRDFVDWQERLLNSPEGIRLQNYWRNQLKGKTPLLHLPWDHPRPADSIDAEADAGTDQGAEYRFKLDRSLSQKIEALAQDQEVTPYMVLLGAFQLLLSRYSGQTDIRVGTPAAVRSRAAFSPVFGDFVNPLILRADLSEDMPFTRFLKQVRRTVIQALKHQDYPFERLAEDLRPSWDPGRSLLFQVEFGLEKPQKLPAAAPFLLRAKGTAVNLGGLRLESVPLAKKAVRPDLALNLVPDRGGLMGAIGYRGDRFEKETIARLADNFLTLLEGITARPDSRLSSLPVVSPGEAHRLLHEFNDTAAWSLPEPTIIGCFEAQVRKTPDNPAVIFEDWSLSYAELNRAANQTAHYLKAHHAIQPNERVGVFLEPSEQLIISLLGILKAGGTYLPLNSNFPPPKRLRYILEDSDCKAIITEKAHEERLRKRGAEPPVICLEDIPHGNRENPAPTAKPSDLAYVIYTSGSTGTPKGVELTHGGFVNMALSQIEQLGIAPMDRVLQLSSPSFDGSMYEIFVALLSGASLFCPSEENCRCWDSLLEAMKDNRVTVAALPPIYIRLIGFIRLSFLRILISAGDQAISDQGEFVDASHHYWNLYGPTEASVTVTAHPIKSGEGADRPIPIGRPIANTRIFILDPESDQLLPIGAVGEICVAGPGVARGYLNQPELTARRFVPHPLDPESRIFRTGDRGRWRPDGRLEFVGRADHQVRLNGMRLELGEIESHLSRIPGVKSAVAMVWTAQSELKELVAYLIGPKASDKPRIKNALRKVLPPHLIPKHFVFMEAFPLTESGKVDRRALPDPRP